ncbi:Crp/Fnr family transcriptional regulator [Anaeromassilibacillus senegalensis]|uniref:Crp/Fnr family transcriptional regulator n=1 Tax=Anaeromassilibacillus senegalensis TaxID=1673717 RepID=UPI00068170F1|nr:Crp/Fnr family transcriptional regulator [Anaeromassilibacillus senegalensis]
MEGSDFFLDARELRLEKNIWRVFDTLQTPRLYAKGQMIYLQGEHAEYLYYLRRGRVKVFLSSENGMEKTLTILEEGEIFGEAAFLDQLPRMSSAKALIRSEIVAVDRACLLQYFARQPALAMDLLRYLARTVRMLSAQVDHMTFLRADQRVAQLLLNLSGAEHKPVSCTHEELANLAGTSRVTVSKILGRFEKEGWIATHYRKISVTAPEQLRSFAFTSQK